MKKNSSYQLKHGLFGNHTEIHMIEERKRIIAEKQDLISKLIEKELAEIEYLVIIDDIIMWQYPNILFQQIEEQFKEIKRNLSSANPQDIVQFMLDFIQELLVNNIYPEFNDGLKSQYQLFQRGIYTDLTVEFIKILYITIEIEHLKRLSQEVRSNLLKNIMKEINQEISYNNLNKRTKKQKIEIKDDKEYHVETNYSTTRAVSDEDQLEEIVTSIKETESLDDLPIIEQANRQNIENINRDNLRRAIAQPIEFNNVPEKDECAMETEVNFTISKNIKNTM